MMALACNHKGSAKTATAAREVSTSRWPPTQARQRVRGSLVQAGNEFICISVIFQASMGPARCSGSRADLVKRPLAPSLLPSAFCRQILTHRCPSTITSPAARRKRHQDRDKFKRAPTFRTRCTKQSPSRHLRSPLRHNSVCIVPYILIKQTPALISPRSDHGLPAVPHGAGHRAQPAHKDRARASREDRVQQAADG